MQMNTMERKASVALIVLVFFVLIIIGVGAWYFISSHNKNTATTTSSASAAGASSSLPRSAGSSTASSIIMGLQTALLAGGYTTSTLATSSPVDGLSFWWFQPNNIGLNIPPTSMWLNIVAASSDENSFFNERGNNISPADDPKIQKFLGVINAYMSSRGLSLQASESTSSSWAYASPGGMRCRFTLYDPNGGKYESYPYSYMASGACADDAAYQNAASTQIPLLQAVWKELGQVDSYGHSISEYYPNVHFTYACPGDPSMVAVEIAGGDGYSAGDFFVKQINGIWSDAVGLDGATLQQVRADCGNYKWNTPLWQW